jgi:hypothetical protein
VITDMFLSLNTVVATPFDIYAYTPPATILGLIFF